MGLAKYVVPLLARVCWRFLFSSSSSSSFLLLVLLLGRGGTNGSAAGAVAGATAAAAGGRSGAACFLGRRSVLSAKLSAASAVTSSVMSRPPQRFSNFAAGSGVSRTLSFGPSSSTTGKGKAGHAPPRHWAGRGFLSIPPPLSLSSSSLSAARGGMSSSLGTSTESSSTLQLSPPRTVAVVGGGLAGLSAAYHLLDLRQKEHTQQRQRGDGVAVVVPLHVTVMDRKPVGTGGASAVAGGLLHPLTPRGTLVRDGLQGLRSTCALIRAAESAWGRGADLAVTVPAGGRLREEGGHDPGPSNGDRNAGERVVLRNELFRIAASERQAQVLKDTAAQPSVSSMAEWIPSYGGTPHGALRLHSGCQVVHVPTYLKGLWAACTAMCASAANDADAPLSVRWETVATEDETLASSLAPYDAVILAAGSGLFAPNRTTAPPILGQRHGLPVQLVRGQSVELVLPPFSDGGRDDPILCGKYISPLPPELREGRAVLVGATHEFQPVPLSPGEVVQELRARTAPFLPPQLAEDVWEIGAVRRITSGVRVQSARGKFGRLPIVGRWDDSSLHPQAWIFTGLSSRGLLHHAMYGETLARAVLRNSEVTLTDEFPDSLWWKPTSRLDSK